MVKFGKYQRSAHETSDNSLLTEVEMKGAPMKLAKNAAERASRGEVIITQKEAKGELGSGWYWSADSPIGDQTKHPHIIDAAKTSDIGPRRATNVGTSSGNCNNDHITTDGDLLMSGSQMFGQVSCRPNTENVGNVYNWVAAIATNFDEYDTSTLDVRDSIVLNSICPRGFQLPNNFGPTVDKSYAKIVLLYTGIGSNSSGLDPSIEQTLRESAISIVRAGNAYTSADGSGIVFGDVGSLGRYTSSRAVSSINSGGFNFRSNQIQAEFGLSKHMGLSMRCVAR